ncbi:MAG: hypothetical protein IJ180_10070 [Bacteroidales bacterium]|nr:hypothetical protein [Bacteroidales bacterium]
MKHFRKIPIILTLAGLTLFIACNNDDDETEIIHNKIMITTFSPYNFSEIMKTNRLDSLCAIYMVTDQI